jgi:hypothetical protein
MAEFQFLSIEASQVESDVMNRFGDRDFLLAVYTCFNESENVTVAKFFAIFLR